MDGIKSKTLEWVGLRITGGTVADCKELRNLLGEVDQKPEHVIADKGYDSDEVRM